MTNNTDMDTVTMESVLMYAVIIWSIYNIQDKDESME